MRMGAMNDPKKNLSSEIEKISKLKFDFIDLTYEWASHERFDREKVKERLTKLNLGVVGHTNPTLPAVYPLPGIKKASWMELKEAFDFFEFLGCEKVSIHPFYYNSHMSDEELISENIILLKKSIDYCSGKGMKLMIENCFSPFGSAREIERITKEIPELSIHLDIGHMNLLQDFDWELNSFLDKFGDKIAHFHIHDNYGNVDAHLPLGCGTVDWASLANKIKKIGYDGTFTLEVFSNDDDYLKISKDKWQSIWNQAFKSNRPL